MTARNTITSLTSAITQTLGSFWDSAKSYLADEPTTLWQKAMEEPGYQAYRQFKSDLAYQSEIALQTIISPYAVIVSHHTTISQKESINQLLCSNPESAVTYFYDDVMNHLVELSYDNSNAEDFTSMLAFYESYVPKEIYQIVIQNCQAIDKANPNFQTKIIDVTKQINHEFKRFQNDRNAERGAERKQEEANEPENAAQTHHKPHHRPSFNQLIMMGAISLLANKNNLRLGLGLATTALFAEPVDAALPTVANPIPTQYAEVGQPFNYDIDLNHVFNDADGDIMTFGGVTMADGSPLPSWLTATPIKLSGRDYANEAWAVEVVGDLAYVANGQYGLLIFNISNPQQKIFVSRFDTPGNAYDVTVRAGIAYVADVSSLQLINVSNSSTPRLLGSYDTPGAARGVTVQAGIAYVADYYSGLQVINVSNASAPSLLGNYDTPGLAYGIIVQAGIAYLADYDYGLQLINVSNASAPHLLSGYDIHASGVALQTGIAYVADGSDLQLINVSNASAPSLLGNYNTPGNARGVTVEAGIAYVADDSFGLQLINVSNAAAPRLLGNYNTPGNAFGITVQAGKAYIAYYGAGLQLINVSNASAPSLLGRYATPAAQGVAVQADIAYVADYTSGLLLINVSNASAPRLMGSYATTGGAYALAVQAGIAYVADYTAGLKLINVSNVSAPRLLGSYDTPGAARSVTVQAGIAYVADSASGLQLIDVNNASAPRLLGSYDTPGSALDITLQAGIAYVGDGSSGLQIIGLGFTRLNAMVPFNATGNYSLKMHATNVNGEWISTDVVLSLLPVAQTSVPSSPTPAPASVMPVSAPAPVQTASDIPPNPSNPATNTPAPQSSNPRRFTVTVSSNPIVIEGGSATLPPQYLSISGNVDPSQVVYTLHGNNPDIIITVNGVEVTQFTQGDVESQFVAISLQGTACQDYDNTLQLQASVAGSSTTVDLSLSVQITTLSCNSAPRLADTDVLNVAALLTATGLGFLAKGREQRERRQAAEPRLCTTAMRQTH